MGSDALRRRFAAWTVASEFQLSELPASTATVDWRIVRDTAAANRNGVTWYHRADAADGLPWVWFGRRDDQDVVRFPGLGWCIFDGADRLACIWRKHLRDEEPEHLLTNHILPLAASRAGLLVMHASVVVRPGGGAVAFTGPVGAGKSTTALALVSKGWRMLSDDRLILDGHHRAYPVAPYLRVAKDAASHFGHDAVLPAGHHKVRLRAGSGLTAHDEPISLERVVFLQNSTNGTAATRLSGRDASLAVLASLLQLGLDQPPLQRRVFERVGSLIAAVPITSLQIVKRWESLSEIEAALQRA